MGSTGQDRGDMLGRGIMTGNINETGAVQTPPETAVTDSTTAWISVNTTTPASTTRHHNTTTMVTTYTPITTNNTRTTTTTAPDPDSHVRHFDLLSFVGGCMFVVILSPMVWMGWKYYNLRLGSNVGGQFNRF